MIDVLAVVRGSIERSYVPFTQCPLVMTSGITPAWCLNQDIDIYPVKIQKEHFRYNRVLGWLISGHTHFPSMPATPCPSGNHPFLLYVYNFCDFKYNINGIIQYVMLWDYLFIPTSHSSLDIHSGC